MAEQSFDDICERMEIPENLRKHVSRETPPRAKMAVARGLLPVPPRTLLAMQYVLLGDASTEVAGEAERSLTTAPEDRLVPLIDRATHPKLLEFLAYKRSHDQRLAEAVALAHQANDKTLCYLAEVGSQRVCEIVAGNQERLIITPQLVLFLQRNENAAQALLDRVRSFQRLYGIEMPGLEEAEAEAQEERAPAPAREPPKVPRDEPEPSAGSPAVDSVPLVGTGTPSPIWTNLPPAPAVSTPPSADSGDLPADFVAGEIYLPAAPTEAYTAPPGLLNPIAELMASWGIAADPNFVAPPEGWEGSDSAGPPIIPVASRARVTGSSDLTQGAEELTGHRDGAGLHADVSGGRSLASTDFTFDFDEETMSFDDELVTAEQRDDDDVRQSLVKKISLMKMADKIKLAYKGNKSVREVLVRDPNKIIGVAVVKSGRISENEVLSIAMNRSINEDVIRALTENREYLRKYPVKIALVNNPKTPISTAMGILSSLHVSDLRKISKNRNVSSAVFTQATKLYKAKKQSMQ